MSLEIESRLEKIPVINLLVKLLKSIKLKAFEGLSFYDLIEMYVMGVVKGALSMRASAISFSLFMALFPFLIFLLNLIPYVNSYVEGFGHEFQGFLEALLPEESSDFFSGIYEDIKKRQHSGLLSSTFFLSIFLIANGINAIFASFENSYHIELTRNFFRQYFYALAIGLMLALLLIFAVVAFIWFEVYVIQYVSDFADKTAGINYMTGDEWGVIVGKILFFFVLTYFSAAILYYFGVVEGRSVKFFSPGALMTTLLIMLTSYLFGLYVDKFSRYNELYGAIGSVLLLMFYIWINCNILLLGFELNASLSRLRKINVQEQESPEIEETEP